MFDMRNSGVLVLATIDDALDGNVGHIYADESLSIHVQQSKSGERSEWDSLFLAISEGTIELGSDYLLWLTDRRTGVKELLASSVQRLSKDPHFVALQFDFQALEAYRQARIADGIAKAEAGEPRSLLSDVINRWDRENDETVS